MADLLARWIAHKGWSPIVHHDGEGDRDDLYVALDFADIRSRLAVTHDRATAYVRATLSTGFNLDGWKRPEAEVLLSAIDDEGFWIFADRAGYLKIGLVRLAQLHDDEDAIITVDRIVGDAGIVWGCWIEELQFVATSNATAAQLLEARPTRPLGEEPLPYRGVFDRDEFERRLDVHLATAPCPATSFSGALH